MGTALVLMLVAGIIFLAIRSILRDKKAGKHICAGNCGGCGGCGCGDHMSDDELLELAAKAAKKA